MTQEIPSKLSDIIGKDLAGWQIRYCHYLELTHGLMGYFPALIKQTNETIFVFSRAALRIVYDNLPRRASRVCNVLCLVNVELKLAFILESKYGVGQNPFHVYFDDELELLSQKPEAFCWAPGLIGGSQEMTEPDFT